MSWWDDPDGEILGDRPADLLGKALEAIVQAREERDEPELSLREVLEAFATALIAHGERFDELVAEQPDGPVLVIRPPVAPDPALVDPLREALAKVDQAYEERWERKPTLAEQLKVFDFVLGSEDFPDAGDPPLRRLTARSS